MTRSAATKEAVMGRSWFAMRLSNTCANLRPISFGLIDSVVRAGVAICASCVPSKPMIEISSPMRRFISAQAARAPMAVISPLQTTAEICGWAARSACIAVLPEILSSREFQIKAGALPIRRIARRKPSSRSIRTPKLASPHK